jgi:hypothetical protein
MWQKLKLQKKIYIVWKCLEICKMISFWFFSDDFLMLIWFIFDSFWVTKIPRKYTRLVWLEYYTYTSSILHNYENATFCSKFWMKSLQFIPTDGIADQFKSRFWFSKVINWKNIEKISYFIFKYIYVFYYNDIHKISCFLKAL